MDLNDLKNYQVKERKPISTSLKDHRILTFPFPSSGSVMLRMLNDMNKSEAFRKSELGDPLYYTELAKIINSAYPCKNKLGDTDDVGAQQEEILNSQLETRTVCEEGSVEETKGTSHISVIDQDELLVSLTTSMNWWYGSLIVTDSGILLNNELDDFSTDPNSPNAAGPGKRPLSSMVPTVVYNEKRPCNSRMAIGGVNGSKILSGVAQTIGNFIFFDGTLKTAVDVPRLFCDGNKCFLNGGNLNADSAGHIGNEISKIPGVNEVEIVDWNLSVVAPVMKRNNTLVAITDDYEDWTGMTY